MYRRKQSFLDILFLWLLAQSGAVFAHKTAKFDISFEEIARQCKEVKENGADHDEGYYSFKYHQNICLVEFSPGQEITFVDGAFAKDMVAIIAPGSSINLRGKFLAQRLHFSADKVIVDENADINSLADLSVTAAHLEVKKRGELSVYDDNYNCTLTTITTA